MNNHKSDTAGETGATLQTLVQQTQDIEGSKHISAPPSSERPRIPGYELIDKPLGEGAYGKVWKARRLRLGNEVAVKVFMSRTGLDWLFLQREVERLIQLDKHRSIVTLLDADLGHEPPYYVMQLLGGGALEGYVDPKQPVPRDRAIHWFEQICEALSYVHSKGLIHCDLKPANILVDEQDNVRIVDFGQSRVFTESSASLGTLYYMAPEQAVVAELGKPVQPDVRWDIYAIGATIYALMTGQVPHKTPERDAQLVGAPNLQARLEQYRNIVRSEGLADLNGSANGAFDRELAAVLGKCLSADPETRYRTIAELQADLDAMRRKRPVSPLGNDKRYRAGKFMQRNPFGVSLGVAVVGLLIALTFLSSYKNRVARGEAGRILAGFVNDPTEALKDFDGSGSRVKSYLAENANRDIESAAFTERIMGARSAPWVATDKFWASVDGGALWQNGEWLEICAAKWGDPAKILDLLNVKDKAAGGSDWQKYVVFCLIGQLAKAKSDLAGVAARAAASESNPGVLSAAWWAAKKLGEPETSPGKSAGLLRNDPSGIIFARIPAADHFIPGSPPDEEFRYHDEDRPTTGMPIASLWMGTTEVTLAQFEPFLRDALASKDFEQIRLPIEKQMAHTQSADRATTAVHSVSPALAMAFCKWLTDRGLGRSYRLPSEEEWEYACRGGGEKAFCYGNDPRYLRYFAAYGGPEAVSFTVATQMPNAYGVFDMHGNLWEMCGSRYRSMYDVPGVLLTDPASMQDMELQLVQRGGAIYSPANACRSAQRNLIQADRDKKVVAANVAHDRLGFRVVMEEGRGTEADGRGKAK